MFTRSGMIGLALVLLLGLAQPVRSEAPVPIEYPAYNGPKKTIAVANFDASGAFVARYGGAELGGGIAAMLISELRRTNRFIVLERGELDRLLSEKQLGLTGIATSTDLQQPLLGAQLFLRGSITEFSEQDKGGGFSVGLNLRGISNAVGKRSRKGTIAIDLRLINAATGVVVSSCTTRRTLKAKSMALQSSRGALSVGTDRFAQTPLGQAVREAIGEAVQWLVAEQEAVPWQALIARTEADRVYVNAGRNSGVAEASRMLVIRTINTITDPATGEVLGAEEATLGEIVIDEVHDRYAVGNFTGSYAPQRDDIVRLVTGGNLRVSMPVEGKE